MLLIERLRHNTSRIPDRSADNVHRRRAINNILGKQRTYIIIIRHE